MADRPAPQPYPLPVADGSVRAPVQAEYGERSPERVTQRNGYRSRPWDTRVGIMELHIPKLREGSYFPSLLEPRRRSERALLAVIQQAYVEGVSTRRVDDLVKALGCEGISKSQVSRICQELDVVVAVITLGAMPVDVREDAVGAIERMIWWADAPPLSADDPPPGVEPAAAVHMPTPTPTPTPSYTPTVLRVGAQRPVMPSPTATSAPTPVRDGLIPLHELRTGPCVDLGKGFMPGQFKNAQRQGPTEAQVVSCDESTRHYRVASIAAAGAYCPRDTRSTITLVDDRAVYCLVHEWKITPTPTLLPGVTPPPTRTLGPTVTPRPTRTPGYPGGIPLTPDGIETWVLHYTNEERATVVLAPFVHDQAISKIAGRHSAMMSRHGYSHTVLGRGPTDRALASGYNCRAYRADGSYTYGLSENIHQLHRVTSWENRGAGWRPLGFTFATDQDMARALVEDWMDSPGHRANILDPQARRIGVGVYIKETVKYGRWVGETVFATQNFSECK